jgi:plastocyanin
MRKIVLGLLATLALTLAAQTPAASTDTKSVQITRTAFVPKTVTINAGDSVTWRNADTRDHQVVANSGAFASPVLHAGQTYTFNFDRGGTHNYHDALYPTHKGTVVVKGAPPSVTLAATQPIVEYGTQVTLSGVVSNKKSGETVTVFGTPYGQTSPAQLAVVQTGANGAYSYTVTPEIYTTYSAQWKSSSSGKTTTSPTVILQVAPKVTLGAGKRHFFRAQVSAGAHSFAGHYLLLQRYNASFSQWISIRKLTLGQLSGRVFQYVPPKHTKVSIRVYLSVNQAGLGYLASHSGSQPTRTP